MIFYAIIFMMFLPSSAADSVGLQRATGGPLPLDLATAGRRTGCARPDRRRQHRNGVASAQKNDIRPWIVETWCVPPKADAEFVWRMQDVIQKKRQGTMD
jgi:hypothetical protein